jgi:alpha-D-ribose 1-methylphosphonate 5-triphosphate synthase subunit PhnH
MISTLSKKHSFDIVFDGQKVFRHILDALSNPTKVVCIREYASYLFGDSPAFLAVAMTLLDNEVSFNADDNHSLSREISAITNAINERVDSADYIFISNPNKVNNVIDNAKSGTITNPHKSATIIIRNDGEPTELLSLYGPGIDGQAEVMVTQTVKDAITTRDAQNYEYPQGIDMIFVSSNGDLFSIPRLVTISGWR